MAGLTETASAMDAIDTIDMFDEAKGFRPKRSTGTSASSRKNKLQRCSGCGGLGHKSRTCELAGLKMGAGVQALRNMLTTDDDKDPRTVLAAYGLLTLSESWSESAPLQPMVSQTPCF